LLDVDNYFNYYQISKNNKHKNYIKILESVTTNSLSRNTNKCYVSI
jgi:hypothetical protein